jgi:hypothetical protein
MGRLLSQWKLFVSVIVGLSLTATLVTFLGASEPKVVAAGPVVTPSASVGVELVRPRESKPQPVAKPATRRVARPRPAAAPAPVVAGGSGQRTALIVGINKAAGAEELQGAVPDAKNVRSALLKYGFPAGNIVTLLDGQATRPAILSELRSLARRSSSNGIAVFALASHSSPTSFRTVEGARISATELGSHLRAVPGKMWNILTTCYAGGYDVPGVSGPGRVATFSSSSNNLTWEAGSAGTYIVRAMVVDGMINGKAGSSVEAAFNYARNKEPSRGVVMNDGISGNFALGPFTWAPKPPAPPAPKPDSYTAPPPATPTPKPKCSGLLGCLFGGSR